MSLALPPTIHNYSFPTLELELVGSHPAAQQLFYSFDQDSIGVQ